MTKSLRKAGSRAKKPRKTANFLHKPSCSTCRKARRFMEKRGFHLNFRDITKHPLRAAELEKLIGRRDHEQFLNPRSEAFEENDMQNNPPSRREAVRMMARDPGLIRRPVIVAGGRVVIGYDENGMMRF
jgi:Spx/MgsR family transcriptional regulator